MELFHGTAKKKSSFPKWITAMLIRACILGGFTVSFLYLRLKLNKTPPLFSGELTDRSSTMKGLQKVYYLS